MNKTSVVVIIFIFIFFFGLFLFFNKSGKTNNPVQESLTTTFPSQAVETKASFAIFTNGTFREFTQAMYHNLSKDAYIEASNPNIIKVKKDDVTWNDFFLTLPLKLTHECLTTGTGQTFCTGNGGILKFYLNGEKKEQVLDRAIKNQDVLLVTFGNESEEIIKKQLERVGLF